MFILPLFSSLLAWVSFPWTFFLYGQMVWLIIFFSTTFSKHHRLIAQVPSPLLGVCMWERHLNMCCFPVCLSAYTKTECKPALNIHYCVFIPGMSCLSTGMTGSSTVVAQKLGMWLITMMAVRSTRTTSSPSWMCVLPSIRSQQYGTEWRLLGGAGLRNQFCLLGKNWNFFFFFWERC